MTTSYYLLTYVFEALISKMYFSIKYTEKAENKIMFLGFSLSATSQFAVSFLGAPELNLIAFLVCNFLLCLLLFEASFLQSIFHSILLSATMMATEVLVFFTSGLFFNIEYSALNTNQFVLWIQAACSKFLYFLFVYLIAKLLTKEHRSEIKRSKSYLLLLLPIASTFLLMGIHKICDAYKMPDYFYFALVITTLLLLYSNIIVFWVHESQIKTMRENTELKLQKQKSELDTEYYTLLQNHYENSNILIHDIKRHLLSIKELSVHNDCESIIKYIDDLYGEYQIKHLKKYSDNKLINAIINRYASLCREFDIDFYCDIRDIDFSFISDANLTSILDNLLENAVEASKNSDGKTIELTVKKSNEKYVVINLSNSCSASPKKVKGELITTKNNKDIHGFGVKSIKRITKEYDGSIDYSFDENKMTFTFTIVLSVNAK